jgi:hypothetical protein
MAINARESYVYHVGETATPFRCFILSSDGTAMTDIASATFTLANRDTGDVLIDAAVCQSVSDGILLYYPEADDMATACRFIAQFTATLSGGAVLPTRHYEGEIEEDI